MIKKIAAITAVGALVAIPAFSFAHNSEGKGGDGKAFDETKVSIAIANDGSTLVRGAKVTEVGDSSLVASTVVNGVTMSWNIDTDGDTAVVEADGDVIDLADVSSGDYVSFSGELVGSTSVDASAVRDWSLTDSDDSDEDDKDSGKHLGFWGKVKAWPGFSFFAHAKADDR